MIHGTPTLEALAAELVWRWRSGQDGDPAAIRRLVEAYVEELLDEMPHAEGGPHPVDVLIGRALLHLVARWWPRQVGGHCRLSIPARPRRPTR